jgi:hypothetical protein
MTANPAPYSLGLDDKVAPVMVYTALGLIWGEVIVKKQIRVSTWLRTNAAPDDICIYNAKVLITTTPVNPPRPMMFPEIHVANPQILALHLLPPEKDPLDYDPTEPNRVMTPITAVVGTFRFDALMRMAAISNLKKYLEVTRENFTALYEADIYNPTVPALGTMHVPFVLVRQSTTMFALR